MTVITMIINIRKPRNFVLFFCLVFCFSLNTGAQSQTEKKEIYQNQQRAQSLSFLKNDIKTAEDAPMRCFLRAQIVKFIFERKITTHSETAKSFALDCLDDIAKNPAQFSAAQSAFWKSTIISLLRVNLPGIAAKAEKKYFLSEEDSGLSDFYELNSTSDSNGVANKIISKIANGEISEKILSLFYKLREKNSDASFRVLDALLKFFENSGNETKFAHAINVLSVYYLGNSTPLELKKRFLYFAVKLGQNALLESDKSNSYNQGRDILEISLPEIKQVIPAIYEQASAIYLTLDSKISKTSREKKDALQRIEESENQLQQTITEAEAAENKTLKDDLWMSAARLAVEKKEFRTAVDSVMKIESKVEIFNVWRNQFLVDEVLTSALRENDFESPEYLLKQIEDVNERGRGTLKIASRFVELKNSARAFEELEAALEILGKAANSTTKVRIFLSAVPIAAKIDKTKTFDVASAVIKVINRLPTPSVDEKIETDARQKYVENVLLPNSFNIVAAFKILAKEDATFAFPLAQEIQRREWRLAAEISAEGEKKYADINLPAPNKKAIQKTN